MRRSFHSTFGSSLLRKALQQLLEEQGATSIKQLQQQLPCELLEELDKGLRDTVRDLNREWIHKQNSGEDENGSESFLMEVSMDDRGKLIKKQSHCKHTDQSSNNVIIGLRLPTQREETQLKLQRKLSKDSQKNQTRNVSKESSVELTESASIKLKNPSSSETVQILPTPLLTSVPLFKVPLIVAAKVWEIQKDESLADFKKAKIQLSSSVPLAVLERMRNESQNDNRFSEKTREMNDKSLESYETLTTDTPPFVRCSPQTLASFLRFLQPFRQFLSLASLSDPYGLHRLFKWADVSEGSEEQQALKDSDVLNCLGSWFISRLPLQQKRRAEGCIVDPMSLLPSHHCFADWFVQPHDTYRLARALSTDSFVTLVDCCQHVQPLLQSPIQHIILNSPALFEFCPKVPIGESVRTVSDLILNGTLKGLPRFAHLFPTLEQSEETTDSPQIQQDRENPTDSQSSEQSTSVSNTKSSHNLSMGVVRFRLSSTEWENAVGSVPNAYQTLSQSTLQTLFNLLKHLKSPQKNLEKFEEAAKIFKSLNLPVPKSMGVVKVKHRLIRSQLRLQFPKGNVFLDRTVLAYLLFDLLPRHTGATAINELREMYFPTMGRVVAPISSAFLTQFPTLWTAMQDENSHEWFLERVDSQSNPITHGKTEETSQQQQEEEATEQKSEKLIKTNGNSTLNLCSNSQLLSKLKHPQFVSLRRDDCGEAETRQMPWTEDDVISHLLQYKKTKGFNSSRATSISSLVAALPEAGRLLLRGKGKFKEILKRKLKGQIQLKGEFIHWLSD